MLNIGIIGCGAFAREHAAALEAIPEARLAACADVIESRARELAEAYPGAAWMTDEGRMLEDPRIDAVYICTHHDSHAALAEKAAAARKYIFMEKPMALTVAECDRIGLAIKRSGVGLMTGFKLRYLRTVEAARTRVPAPLLSIAQLCDDRWPDDFWANDPVKGGGNVLSQGCHAVDLLCALNPSEPIRVLADGGNLTHTARPQKSATPHAPGAFRNAGEARTTPGRGVDETVGEHAGARIDTLTASLRFSNGALASISISDAGASPVVSKFSIQLMDGERAAHLHDRCLALDIRESGRSESSRMEADDSIFEENRHFVNCILRGLPFRTGFKEGKRAAMILEAAMESAASGSPVFLEPEQWNAVA